MHRSGRWLLFSYIMTRQSLVRVLVAGGICLALLPGFRLADDPFVARLLARLDAYMRAMPSEKVYVQTDRDQYLPGETVWLSGYLFDGVTHAVDSVSGVLYVELIDPVYRQRVLRAQLRTTGGRAPGQLTLPDSLKAGSYQLRAFTNYMRNAAPDYYFTKTLTVLPVNVPSSRSQSVLNQKIDLQFMPEGGRLVTGLDSRIAFKAVDQSGRGCAVTGFVLDARNDTVIGFRSQRLGMGFFTFRPEPGQTYTAFVQPPGGRVAPVAFPTVQPVGAVMTVDNMTNKDNIRVYVANNRPVTADNGPPAELTLVAQTRGIVVQVAKAPLNKKAFVVQLPRQQFPEGIAQLTLFDETNMPVCERLVFIEKNNRLKIDVKADASTVKPRGKVDLNLTVTTPDGKPASAALSLAVTDGQLVPPDTNAATLVSSLLLTSDLAGTVEQPGYYFDTKHDARLQDLDLLLMTQGWRRFTWQQVLTDSLTRPRYPLEAGLSLTGRVLRANQKAAGKVRLTFMLTLPDSSRTVLAGESDETGTFGAYGLDFADSTSVLIQAVRGKNDRYVDISLDQLLQPAVVVTHVPFNPMVFAQSEYDEFIRRTREYLAIERQIRGNREVLLKEVVVKARRTEERDLRKIYGTADATVKFDLQNTAGALTVLDVIRGRVAGVQVTGSGFNTSVVIRGPSSITGPNEPLYVLDGMQTQKETIFSIPVNDVDYVDVLKGPSAAIYGSQGAGGVIIVMTKRGNSADHDYSKDPAAGLLLAKVPGYAPVREFYAPRYDQPQPVNRPDYRATLHWAPLIRTDASGKARVTFFASDAKTTVHVVAEGVGPIGQPGTTTAQVRVD